MWLPTNSGRVQDVVETVASVAADHGRSRQPWRWLGCGSSRCDCSVGLGTHLSQPLRPIVEALTSRPGDEEPASPDAARA